MIYVGIDVSKDKHDCFIYNSSGEILNDGFSFKNNADGFQQLLNSIPNVSNDNVRVGLESTGHYSLNLIQFLDRHNLSPIKDKKTYITTKASDKQISSDYVSRVARDCEQFKSEINLSNALRATISR